MEQTLYVVEAPATAFSARKSGGPFLGFPGRDRFQAMGEFIGHGVGVIEIPLFVYG